MKFLKLIAPLCLLLFVCCDKDTDVLLPDLIPNEQNGVSDMVIIEINAPVDVGVAGDEELTITSSFLSDVIDNEFCSHLSKILEVENGSLLGGFPIPDSVEVDPDSPNKLPYLLNENDLIGGAIPEAKWEPYVNIISGAKFPSFPPVTCFEIPVLFLASEGTAVEFLKSFIGFRFKASDDKLHYGWLELQATNTDGGILFDSYIFKRIAYNKKAGVNVRVGH